MELLITIAGSRTAGKSTLARLIAAICEEQRLSYRITDGTEEIIKGPMAAAADEAPEIIVTTIEWPSRRRGDR
jgi:thymidylate kinase